MDNRKILIAVGLLAIIVGMGIYLIIGGKSLFEERTVITYGDGCVEEFIDGVLNGTECTAARERIEEQKRLPMLTGEEWINLNITI